jgi:hypothetical protein
MPETRDPAAEILALETELLRPETRLSPPRLADDFLEFTASGATCDKAACLAALPRQPAAHFEIDAFALRLLAPTLALATYRLTQAGSAGPSHSLRSSLWRREAGGWRMAFHQGTPAAA